MGLVFIVVPFLPSCGLFLDVGFTVAERILFMPRCGAVLVAVTGLTDWRQSRVLPAAGVGAAPGQRGGGRGRADACVCECCGAGCWGVQRAHGGTQRRFTIADWWNSALNSCQTGRMTQRSSALACKHTRRTAACSTATL